MEYNANNFISARIVFAFKRFILNQIQLSLIKKKLFIYVFIYLGQRIHFLSQNLKINCLWFIILILTVIRHISRDVASRKVKIMSKSLYFSIKKLSLGFVRSNQKKMSTNLDAEAQFWLAL